MRSTVQLVSILDSIKLSCVIDYDDLGYCFGGPFALELATTDDVVACKAVSQFRVIVSLSLNLILPGHSCFRASRFSQ
jgi:hypothetical protein